MKKQIPFDKGVHLKKVKKSGVNKQPVKKAIKAQYKKS